MLSPCLIPALFAGSAVSGEGFKGGHRRHIYVFGNSGNARQCVIAQEPPNPSAYQCNLSECLTQRPNAIVPRCLNPPSATNTISRSLSSVPSSAFSGGTDVFVDRHFISPPRHQNRQHGIAATDTKRDHEQRKERESRPLIIIIGFSRLRVGAGGSVGGPAGVWVLLELPQAASKSVAARRSARTAFMPDLLNRYEA